MCHFIVTFSEIEQKVPIALCLDLLIIYLSWLVVSYFDSCISPDDLTFFKYYGYIKLCVSKMELNTLPISLNSHHHDILKIHRGRGKRDKVNSLLRNIKLTSTCITLDLPRNSSCDEYQVQMDAPAGITNSSSVGRKKFRDYTKSIKISNCGHHATTTPIAIHLI